FLLGEAFAELLLEFHELLHELAVEPFLLFRELVLGALPLCGFPFFDARELGVALLLERRDHRIYADAEPPSLIGHPLLDALGGLLDRALQLLARRCAKRIPRRDGRALRGPMSHGREWHGQTIVVRRIERANARGVLEGRTQRSLGPGSESQAKG